MPGQGTKSTMSAKLNDFGLLLIEETNQSMKQGFNTLVTSSEGKQDATYERNITINVSHEESISSNLDSHIMNTSTGAQMFGFDEDTFNLYATSGNSTTATMTSSQSESFGEITNSSSLNGSIFDEILPKAFTEMSESSKNSVIAYSILFIIALVGNLTVFVSVFKEYRKQRGRISLLILHLAAADLMVCLCLIPIEVVWRITIQWYGGNLMCKLCQFLRAFGLYLSSMVVICVSVDRFFAILYPFKTIEGRQRVKNMLWMAWIAAGVFAVPQVIFFSVESHPSFPSFKQCVTSSFLAHPEDARLYSIFSVSAMYFAPLVVIIFTYSAILVKMIRKSRESTGTSECRRPLRSSASSTMSERGGSLRLPQKRRLRGTSLRGPMSSSHHGLSESWKKNIRESGDNGGTHHHHHGTTTSVGLMSRDNCPSTSNTAVVIVNSQGSQSTRVLHFENEVTRSYRGSCSSSSSRGGEGGGCTIGTNSGNNAGACNSSPSSSSDVRSSGKAQLILRMSGNAVINISRARTRTLRMTIVILLVFIVCWTPYVVMTLWYMFDWNGAKKVDPKIQDGLFIMAVANSCVNPLVYGTFSRNSCKGVSKDLTRNQSCRFT